MEGLVTRFKKLMDDSELSAAQMADKIGVQRSAISHVLSGRNKPSLDFVLKVLDAFGDVSAEWLLKGEKQPHITTRKATEKDLSFPAVTDTKKRIEKVLILYADKTVEEYRASNP